MYNALIMAKLVYALESLALPDRLLDKLNTFHLRGLRQLLGMRTTFIRRENTNELVLHKASERVNAIPGGCAPRRRPAKLVKIRFVSDMVQERAAKLLGELTRSPPERLMRAATLEPGTAMPKFSDTRRSGRPKNSWIELTMRRIWIQHEGWALIGREAEAFDLCKEEHVDYMYSLAVHDMM